MGRNVTLYVLAGLLALSVLGSVGVSVLYFRNVREFRSLQAQAAQVNQRQALVQRLVTDALAYSNQNPAIDPILQSVGVKPAPAQPNPNR